MCVLEISLSTLFNYAKLSNYDVKYPRTIQVEFRRPIFLPNEVTVHVLNPDDKLYVSFVANESSLSESMIDLPFAISAESKISQLGKFSFEKEDIN